MSFADERQIAVAMRVLSDAWETQRHQAYVSLQLHGRIERLPDLSFEGAVAKAAAATALIARIDAIDVVKLPDPIAIAMRQARYGAELRSRAADWYWTVIDPTGVGFYGLFLPSGYCGGYLLNFVLRGFESSRIVRAGDFDRYLGRLGDLSVLVDQMSDRTRGQAERGMRIPKPQLPAACALIDAFRARLAKAFVVSDASIATSVSSRAGGFRAQVARCVADDLEPAFDRLAAIFDADYEAASPESVGLSQFPDGEAIYRELIRFHTTLPLSPSEVHAEGMRRLVTIESDMRALRAASGLADEPKRYLDRIKVDPRFSASTAHGVASVFQRYIDRMDSVFDRAFHAPTKSRPGVAPLPASLEGSMTFGYYDAPKPGQDMGRYLFNAAQLTRLPLANVAALTFHELIPGHHQHLASQDENEALHPIGRFTFCNAFNEGWAEYAATLAGELGLYVEPEERYGRMMMDAFLTSRLVVDTGMNALGWTLDDARRFLRDRHVMSESELRSETLRYSCDIPAQALAYKLGDTEMLRMRETMRSIRGERFDLRDFHRAVLEHGAMPLPDLAVQIERASRQAL